MQYRDFGKIDFKPSALGFGAMRLPVLTDADGRPEFKRIDYPAATAMLHRAIEGGVNYVDTAWMYHEDTCETWLGEALKGGYRERVKIATKMPVWNVKKPDDFERILGTQLERLQEQHIDFYLLHALDGPHWKNVVEQGQLAAAERALADGRIGHLGFSFHGQYRTSRRSSPPPTSGNSARSSSTTWTRTTRPAARVSSSRPARVSA